MTGFQYISKYRSSLTCPSTQEPELKSHSKFNLVKKIEGSLGFKFKTPIFFLYAQNRRYYNIRKQLPPDWMRNFFQVNARKRRVAV